jgi:signal transduction histidine kinase
VRIEDNGKGIPKEYLEKIFEPFFTTKGSKGTGLGLAMTRKVVEDMGAKITVESEEGEGTVFVIQFSSTSTDAGLTDNDGEDTGAGH